MATHHKPLTVKSIGAIKPPTIKGQQDEYFDTSRSGFSLRVGTSGRKVFTQFYRYRGKVKRYTIGPYPAWSLKDARKKASEVVQMAAEGIDPSLEKKKKRTTKLTFEELAEQYIEQYAKPNKRTWKEDKQKLEKKFSVWNDSEASTISRDDVLDRIEYIKQNHGPVTANRNLALIRKLFRWAKEKRLVPDNPVTDVPREPENTRDNMLNDQEIRAFWEGCEEKGYPFGPCFQLMLITGRREGSVSKMRWTDIDMEAKEWAIPSELDKSGKPQIVPLPDLAIEILRNISQIGALVFTTTGTTPISGFSRAKKDLDKLCGVDKWQLHDLRRTCRTNLPRLGVAPDISRLTIGHKLQGIDAVYDRYSYMPEKRGALNKWAEFIQGLLEDKESRVVPFHG